MKAQQWNATESRMVADKRRIRQARKVSDSYNNTLSIIGPEFRVPWALISISRSLYEELWYPYEERKGNKRMQPNDPGFLFRQICIDFTILILQDQ